MSTMVHGHYLITREFAASAATGDRNPPDKENAIMPKSVPTDPLADPAATAASDSGLRHAPATARNREPIRQALAELLPARPCTVLEIASGSGEHALWMARCLPQVTWAPSEATADGLAAIEGWRALCPDLADRVPPPVLIDAARPPWPGAPVDAVFVANLTHIAPWSATLGLVRRRRCAACRRRAPVDLRPLQRGRRLHGARQRRVRRRSAHAEPGLGPARPRGSGRGGFGARLRRRTGP